jgi:hypothetical protein
VLPRGRPLVVARTVPGPTALKVRVAWRNSNAPLSPGRGNDWLSGDGRERRLLSAKRAFPAWRGAGRCACRPVVRGQGRLPILLLPQRRWLHDMLASCVIGCRACGDLSAMQ